MATPFLCMRCLCLYRGVCSPLVPSPALDHHAQCCRVFEQGHLCIFHIADVLALTPVPCGQSVVLANGSSAGGRCPKHPFSTLRPPARQPGTQQGVLSWRCRRKSEAANAFFTSPMAWASTLGTLAGLPATPEGYQQAGGALGPTFVCNWGLQAAIFAPFDVVWRAALPVSESFLSCGSLFCLLTCHLLPVSVSCNFFRRVQSNCPDIRAY